nr:hypothetical protein GCM10020063_070820 [Dactylosporangium thailandense]
MHDRVAQPDLAGQLDGRAGPADEERLGPALDRMPRQGPGRQLPAGPLALVQQDDVEVRPQRVHPVRRGEPGDPSTDDHDALSHTWSLLSRDG